MYQAGYYQGLSESEIAQQVTEEGFDPIRIADPPGHVYPVHSHAETKLLAFLHGSMRVKAGDRTYDCKAGDRLLIPGNLEHAAWVGSAGCTYFWSEKIL